MFFAKPVDLTALQHVLERIEPADRHNGSESKVKRAVS
jgi:hypothetical protein